MGWVAKKVGGEAPDLPTHPTLSQIVVILRDLKVCVFTLIQKRFISQCLRTQEESAGCKGIQTQNSFWNYHEKKLRPGDLRAVFYATRITREMRVDSFERG